jgi:hypothetical protein
MQHARVRMATLVVIEWSTCPFGRRKPSCIDIGSFSRPSNEERTTSVLHAHSAAYREPIGFESTGLGQERNNLRAIGNRELTRSNVLLGKPL